MDPYCAFLRSWCAFLLCAVVACSSSSGGGKRSGHDGGGQGGLDGGATENLDGGGRRDGGAGDDDGGSTPQDGRQPSRALIKADEGGEVVSDDGALTLYVPPGALAEDTELAIRTLPKAEWPRDIAESEPLGEVYELTPDGLRFVTPAVLRQRFETTPAALRDGSNYVFAHHFARSTSGVVEPALRTDTYFHDDGSAEVVAVIEHLSSHYATVKTEDGARLLVAAQIDTNAHYVGEVWRAARLHFQVDKPIACSQYGVTVEVISPQRAYLSPVGRRDWGSWRYGDSDEGWEEVAYIGLTESPNPEGRRGLRQHTQVDEDQVLMPNQAIPLSTPLPGFKCEDVGDTDRMMFWARVRRGEQSIPEELVLKFGPAVCLKPVGPRPRASILLGDYCEATRETSTIVCLTDMTGSLANVIVPAPSITAQLSDLNPTTTLFEGVTNWDSVAGPSTLEFTTQTHTVTATYNNGRYEFEGLTPGPVFTHPENLLVSGASPSASTPVTVEVPSIAITGGELLPVLGDVNGLETEMRFPDGQFDAMYVYATATGSSVDGEAGVMRLVPAVDMALDGANIRSAPLFDQATRAELEALGLTLDTILVGPVHVETNDALFPGETVPVMAGRFHRFSAKLLEPMPPAGECLPSSADLTLAANGRASLCYDTNLNVCGMQHKETCSLSTRIGYFTVASESLRFVAGQNDTIVSASHGTINNANPTLANRVEAIPSDTDVTIVMDMATGFGDDHVKFTFRRTGDKVEIINFQRVTPAP